MDKEAYFQSVYEAQFALGKKTGACLSAQYLALEAFIQRSEEWHYSWWPIVGITPEAWCQLQRLAQRRRRSKVINTRGIIRAHLHDRVERGRALFRRDTPLRDAWQFYETRDSTILALSMERDKVSDIDWLPLAPDILGQQAHPTPVITMQRFHNMRTALNQSAA